MPKKSWIRLLVLGALCCLLLLLPAYAAPQENLPLSPALEVLAKGSDLALWHFSDEVQSFSEESFLRGLNLSDITEICITRLPRAEEGILWLDRKPIEAGSHIFASALSRMTFESASENIKSASFGFEVNRCGIEYTCRLYALDAQNASPQTDGIPALYSGRETHKNLPLSGRFYAKDPEGDPMTFEIASYPRYGSITVAKDRYTYLPFPNYTGEDSFSYVARDLYGNYSASVQVTLSVTGTGADLVFADLDEPELQSAVLTLAAGGIHSGTQVGSKLYFYPDRAITRAEFLVLAMNAAGISELPECRDTGFFDDGEIPEGMKAYVAVAYRLGYIKGTVKEGKLCFSPAQAMSRGEAAQLLQKLLPLETPKSVAALGEKSDDAAQSIAVLAEQGFLFRENATKEALSRREAVKLLADLFLLCR